MVTNKGLFFAALTLGLCIILASIISSMATVKAAFISGKARGMQYQAGERGMPGCDMMGQRGDDRREGMRGDRRERDDERGDVREMRRGRRDGGGMQQFRGERNDWQRGNDRDEGPRGMRQGGGGAMQQLSLEPECDGSGYLFN